MRSTLLVAALALFVAGARLANAEEAPYWPSEQQDRLTQVGDDIIEVMHQQRKARFEKDEEKLKQLNERMKELKEEKVELLRATGDLE